MTIRKKATQKEKDIALSWVKDEILLKDVLKALRPNQKHEMGAYPVLAVTLKEYIQNEISERPLA